LNQFVELLNTAWGGVEHDWEGRELVGFSASALEVEQSQIPSDVVKCRAEIVNNIAQDRSERRRGCRIGRNPVDHIVEVTRIELTSEVIRVSIKEDTDLPLKFV
jgi:hypothetical protein